MQKTTVERAFELARDGSCRHVADIRVVLRNEGYGAAQEHLVSKVLKAQLKSAIKHGSKA